MSWTLILVQVIAVIASFLTGLVFMVRISMKIGALIKEVQSNLEHMQTIANMRAVRTEEDLKSIRQTVEDLMSMVYRDPDSIKHRLAVVETTLRLDTRTGNTITGIIS